MDFRSLQQPSQLLSLTSQNIYLGMETALDWKSLLDEEIQLLMMLADMGESRLCTCPAVISYGWVALLSEEFGITDVSVTL